jgi:NADPH-dependent 2,4-dienoyl-CoA reductase/sulfur reductase-like enzyme
MRHVVIIGNGISGITAARHIRKLSDHRISVISSETPYFFSRTALMYVYMGHLRFEHTKPYEDHFWKKNRIDLLYDHVEEIHPKEKSLKLKNSGTVIYDVLIIATGSQSARGAWPGQDAEGVQGLYSYADLQLMEKNTHRIKRGVIVGGGLIGIEMAEMLRSRNIEVTFLVREKEFWSNVLPLQEANLISRHIRSHHVELKLETELKEILTNAGNQVTGVVTNRGETTPCEFVGLTIGVSPNISIVRNSGIAINKGVLVNEFLETNIPDVYAIGDCAERTYDLPGRKRIEQVWYTGRMMGEVVAQTVCGQKTPYAPGPWFNSAKFFDIEYQTYGNVHAERATGEEEFYWEHDSGRKCMHFVWQGATGRLLGVNTFGIRLRHECFDRWLRETQSIFYVMDHLHEANFDPEFFHRHEDEIRAVFEKKFQMTNA